MIVNEGVRPPLWMNRIGAKSMGDELVSFLARHEPIATEDVVWGEQMRLRLTAYLGAELPPQSYVSSVRAIVVCGESVLVQRDRDSTHIVPGGRIEEDETPEAALRREIGEETGWTLGRVEVIGFLHFLHLDPKAPGYRYPYPSFLQVMYAAEAIVRTPEIMLDDDYVIGSELLTVAAVRELELTPKEYMYLDATLKRNDLT